ncbi:hypothetical protein [Streptomyces fildesensis]|uniref:hypothetical protein n=1 Tax=Streptomyces fildesensis TaxID=375757 RepID=UPI003F687C85
MNQIGHVLISAPDTIRARYRTLHGKLLIEALARLRPTGDAIYNAVLTALESLARRVQALAAEHQELTATLDDAVTELNPGLRAAHGVSPDAAAQLLITAGGNPDRFRAEASFAALCGVATVGCLQRQDHPPPPLTRRRPRCQRCPLPDSTRPHGQRPPHPRLRGLADRGRPDEKEIIRLLKRAIAREAFCYLTTTVAVSEIADLRPTRQAKNITLTAVAHHFGVWPAVISCMERGTRRDDHLANAYGDWLTAA